MNYLSESGPLVWLVLLLGIVGLVAALRYALQRIGKHRSLAMGAAAACGAVAVLATVTGFQRSISGLRDVAADERWIYLVGLQESLNNVVVALVFVVLISLLLTAGAYRARAA